MTHPKRPRDPNRLAKSIIDIATGQKPDRTPEELGKSAKAVARGGGRLEGPREARPGPHRLINPRRPAGQALPSRY
jgi:hypothetical protein